MVRNTYIYPPDHSMRIISDIFAYTSQNMPKFNSISVSGYHMQEAGASADLELGYTLADGVEYVRAGIAARLDIDQIRTTHLVLLGDWHELLHGDCQDARGAHVVGKTDEAVRASERTFDVIAHPLPDLRLVADGTGCVQQRDPHQPVEAMAATQGQTQSLHTNALDEALALPTDFSARIARNTQLFLQQEAGACQAIDPWGGSFFIERLTHDLAAKAWAHIQDIEDLGGMAKAIAAGVPKLKIEESAARTQAASTRASRPWSASTSSRSTSRRTSRS